MSTKDEREVACTMISKWTGQTLPLAGGQCIKASELSAVRLQRQNRQSELKIHSFLYETT